jgi:integrase
MRRFYTHTRHNGIIYAELVDPISQKKLPARSTRTKNSDEAAIVIAKWLEDGLPCGKAQQRRPLETVMDFRSILSAINKTELSKDEALRIVNLLKRKELIDISACKTGNGSISFGQYLKDFWTYATSRYVQDRIAHGYIIGKSHCYDALNRVKCHWLPAFAGKNLSEITKTDLKDFSFSLSHTPIYASSNKGLPAKPAVCSETNRKMLSPASINKILTCGFVALKWAYHEGLIPADPTDGLSKFAGKKQKRGVLTPDEARKVFAAAWSDQRAYCAAILACTTGLRSGEIRALRKSDIGNDFLHIRHSWSDYDHLKTTKNGEERKVPLVPNVRKQLMALAKLNPHEGEDAFLFYSTNKDKPVDGRLFLDGIKAVCASLGIDCSNRHIDFHSFRHFYAARMVDKMTPEQVARVTGHKSIAIFEQYADHITEENLKEMANAGSEVFGKVLKKEKRQSGSHKRSA